jgi:two-component system nitrogen regulation sensor histidine kinase NtrY
VEASDSLSSPRYNDAVALDFASLIRNNAGFVNFVVAPRPIRPAEHELSKRRKVIYLLAASVTLLLAIIVSQTSFDLNFLNPDSNQQIVFFVGISTLVFLLFVALTYILVRNLIKLFAERRLGVLGSKFRTRIVVASLLLSFLPVIFMFFFAYGLMNRSINKWFSRPVEQVREDTNAMASLLSDYAAQNAHAEAVSIASTPETRYAFEGHSFNPVAEEFHTHEATLQGGFAVAILDGNVEASYGAPAPWPLLKALLPRPVGNDASPLQLTWQQTNYVLSSAPVGKNGIIVVGMPLPETFSATMRQLEASQQRYFNLAAQYRKVRRMYMTFLLLLTVLVLFTTMWLALFLSKLVMRPVAALAEATQEISRGRLDYRVEVTAADEIGDLVRSFNRMAEELESNRHQIESSRRELAEVNATVEQRRQHMETILESIPTGVLSLDSNRRITHSNHALLRLFRPKGGEDGALGVLIGATLPDIFPREVIEDLEPLLRRADRMGTTTTQMELPLQSGTLNVAVTVATLRHRGQGLGYVLVFEDLSDVLKAQKQAAWREVARRVAHEIKNPLTPISLSAERILRHLDRGANPDVASLRVMQGCAETISGAVDTVRTLVNEFAALASFPTAQPEPSDINSIIENTLSMFNGRLDGIHVHTLLASDLPKVMADPEAIRRAFANLVDNAAEAMQDAVLREINISTSLVTSRDAIEITVSDSGPGVTQDLKEKLFLPYFSTKKRGTGLGLAIVSRIIEEHHGSIRVEENRPVGARFIVELPVAVEAVQPVISQHA